MKLNASDNDHERNVDKDIAKRRRFIDEMHIVMERARKTRK